MACLSDSAMMICPELTVILERAAVPCSTALRCVSFQSYKGACFLRRHVALCKFDVMLISVIHQMRQCRGTNAFIFRRCRASAVQSRRLKLPVQEMVSTPGPKYSTMAPVPPFTVRIPATLQMMSLGEFHLASLPVSFTPITCSWHDIHENQPWYRCLFRIPCWLR